MATHGVAAVGALPLGFKVKLGLARGKYLPAGLHAAGASCVSAALVTSVWSCKMPLAKPQLYLIFWMVRLEWTLRITLFGPGFV